MIPTFLSSNGHGQLAYTTLSDAQLANHQAGEMCVNVHGAAHEAGEIRAQLSP